MLVKLFDLKETSKSSNWLMTPCLYQNGRFFWGGSLGLRTSKSNFMDISHLQRLSTLSTLIVVVVSALRTFMARNLS
ncbi:hypothetical protein GDO81_007052 [Engystomops pustulosus]|uniref:Uncharacterized protein n=1 Tax=Engystomops pustulosus TaxID=76066 RepID=A0AAV7C4R7_ENGPU|nr:hypothetical protein GDO81_007052 [Engystomops pustulosus]